jgi:two-component system, OmpR family, copper resistance phosphate regulon response regulator CusR
MKILVIKDETKTARFLRKGLIEAGFVVDVAGDGAHGLNLALETEFDLIVLDLTLPVLDGWHVLSRFREKKKAGARTHSNGARRRARTGPRIRTGCR